MASLSHVTQCAQYSNGIGYTLHGCSHSHVWQGMRWSGRRAAQLRPMNAPTVIQIMAATLFGVAVLYTFRPSSSNTWPMLSRATPASEIAMRGRGIFWFLHCGTDAFHVRLRMPQSGIAVSLSS
jgi:hypothetical protein